MTPRAVLAALDNGKMRVQAAKLSEQEKKAVAQWVTNTKLGDNSFPKDAYTLFSRAFRILCLTILDGVETWKERAIVMQHRQGYQLSTVSSLKLKWAFAFPDATLTRSKPAIAGDWLIVGGQFGDVLALNRKTGKDRLAF